MTYSAFHFLLITSHSTPLNDPIWAELRIIYYNMRKGIVGAEKNE